MTGIRLFTLDIGTIENFGREEDADLPIAFTGTEGEAAPADSFVFAKDRNDAGAAAYDPAFTGGVRVAVGDVNGDGDAGDATPMPLAVSNQDLHQGDFGDALF